MTTPALRVENLTVRYGRVPAISDVSICLEQGCHGIIGANGAGKTSLLRGISGLAETSASRIWIGNQRIDRETQARRACLGLGHVLEHRHLFPNLTVRANLQLGSRASRQRSGQFNLTSVCDLFPALSQYLSLPAAQLSGGQQQMVAIGRALMGNPSVLLLDEPTVGLAPIFIEDVLRSVSSIVSTGTAVLLVEQRLDIVVKLASTVYILVHGKVQEVTDAKNPALEEMAHAAYLS
jgi:branched-chain amino acid transport system ATP-binding protein